MRRTMTDKGVAALKPRAARYAVSDPELRGHWIRIQPSGSKSFWTVTRNPQGKQIWTLIGPADMEGGIEGSRDKARAILARVRDGLPAVEAKGKTFAEVAGNWMMRHVEAKGLRSHYEVNRLLKAHVLPAWKDRVFTSIRKSDVTALLDKVEDDHGARQADYVLSIVRKIMNWQETRIDDYVPPIVSGMRRRNPKEHERNRKLSEDEIRAVWKVAEAGGSFGVLVRLLLLTAQRRAKVVSMRWQDIAADGTWTIATERDENGKTREKGNAGELVLPQLALDIIRAQPRFAGNSYVLAGRGNGHYKSLSDAKKALNQKVAAVLPNMSQWQLHDLRRTARSLMSRAGVLSEHAEKVLGHAVGGVEGVYDRHEYAAEKADALRKLAALIDAIVHPQPADVVPLESKRTRRSR